MVELYNYNLEVAENLTSFLFNLVKYGKLPHILRNSKDFYHKINTGYLNRKEI